MQKKLVLRLLTFMLTGFHLISQAQNALPLVPGMQIQQNTVIQPGLYQLKADTALTKSLIRIQGSNITVDFAQAILDGSPTGTLPNQMRGLAIYIVPGSKNITLKNLVVKGYQIAILADSVQGLTIQDCNLSYNYRQQLHSQWNKEDISDWMSFHHNEKDEWMRYGAAIYLKNCDGAKIHGNLVTGGQCALMLTNCNKGQVYDNDFSFNSGLGIGMYRSSFNQVYHNKLDYNVRGSSFGFYRRGQDSAGILVFEQSSENVFAYNSVTHGGDGFFLWAGQTTMDSATGGCNHNLLYGNDFSFAPTNGAELTFSTNTVLHNRFEGCDHGIWGGYSYSSDFSDNVFVGNRIGIAIEHGQSNNIAMNRFLEDGTAIKLWSREKQPADWTYAKLRNTASKNYWITSNRFSYNKLVYDIMGTDSSAFGGNKKMQVAEIWKWGERLHQIDTSREGDLLDLDYQEDKRLASIPAKTLPAQGFPQGIDQIRITPWGPYDFKSPLLWMSQIDSLGLYHFEVLGPKGEWALNKLHGFEILTRGPDSLPSKLLARLDSNTVNPMIQLQYKGAATTDAFGKTTAAGIAQYFSWKGFTPKENWQVSWYAWDSLSHPENALPAFEKLLTTTPIKTATVKDLNYIWWGKIDKELPADSFATVATTTMNFPKDLYQLSITADDLVRVYLDGKMIIDAWSSSYTQYDEGTSHMVELALNGKHQLKVVHAEKTGLASLQLQIRPKSHLLNSPVVAGK